MLKKNQQNLQIVTTARITRRLSQTTMRFQATFSDPTILKIKDLQLIVPRFSIRKYNQTFINPVVLKIDLSQLQPAHYRVIAVQNFHVEDTNPNLDECLCGIFLAAKKVDGSWEIPENFPVECRTIKIIGYIHLV